MIPVWCWNEQTIVNPSSHCWALALPIKQRNAFLFYNCSTKLHLSIMSAQQHAAVNVIFATLCAVPQFFVTALSVCSASYIHCYPWHLSCQLHLLLPSVFVLPFSVVLAISAISDLFFLCHFYFVAAHSVDTTRFKIHCCPWCPWCLHLFVTSFVHCCLLPMHSQLFIAALSIALPFIFVDAWVFVLPFFICSQPISCIDAMIFAISFICWCSRHLQLKFIAAHGVCAASPNFHLQFAVPIMDCPWYLHCHASFLLPLGFYVANFINFSPWCCTPIPTFVLLPLAFALLQTFNLCCQFHCVNIFGPCLQSTICHWFTAHYKMLTVCLQKFLLCYQWW